jgi:signal-transduction protein with cAMP-binding, CBS, and nucleotidyltransferase domain
VIRLAGRCGFSRAAGDGRPQRWCGPRARSGNISSGIFSERDYARKVILLGKASKDTRVSEIMTDKVLYVTPDRTVDECMAIMTEKHFRHLPVLDDEGRFSGLFPLAMWSRKRSASSSSSSSKWKNTSRVEAAYMRARRPSCAGR